MKSIDCAAQVWLAGRGGSSVQLDWGRRRTSNSQHRTAWQDFDVECLLRRSLVRSRVGRSMFSRPAAKLDELIRIVRAWHALRL